MTDDQQESSSEATPELPDASSESAEVVAEETIIEMSETRTYGSIKVVGYQVISAEDAPDMGGLPPADPVEAPPPLEPQASADSPSPAEE